MRVALTGSRGFIGSFLLQRWAQEGLDLLPLTRAELDLAAPFDAECYLQGVDVVVHTAGRAHVLHEMAADPLAEFRAVNVAGTERLAKQAARAGVRRFVLLSTIGVLGSQTNTRGPFAAVDHPAPRGPYAVSKWEAEQAAMAVAAAMGMELVVVRPPLVVGPGAKGNLQRLVRLLQLGVPLPLAALRNRRSFVGLTNLAALLRSCLDHPAAAGSCWLAADPEPVSTAQLICWIAAGLGRRARLWPLPPAWLAAAGWAVGRADAVRRLMDSLEVDASATGRCLSWEASCSLAAEVQAMARHQVREGWG